MKDGKLQYHQLIPDGELKGRYIVKMIGVPFTEEYVKAVQAERELLENMGKTVLHFEPKGNADVLHEIFNRNLLDNNDLIARLNVLHSNFQFKENPLGFSFPCCICEHNDKDQMSEECAECGHSG
ncbi:MULTISPECIES: hypothetical protein [Vibrio]|uniref:Uncharacterized protein n=1 Tax=Vibrio vulnificus TaxID=672 RepID=A0A2S3R1E9_VIBVL|nr:MULTISPECIES: hypothetical protein [Vibrio]MCZ2801991.1 hypothetical protein [Vibrio alginolyticus]POB46924.1 hypothetical protein CRN52_12655 [Vibrio vulnificus]